jgi:hypothetical protein
LLVRDDGLRTALACQRPAQAFYPFWDICGKHVFTEGLNMLGFNNLAMQGDGKVVHFVQRCD